MPNMLKKSSNIGARLFPSKETVLSSTIRATTLEKKIDSEGYGFFLGTYSLV